MNSRTSVGILAVASGFLLIWGGATGRLGSAWGALVHGTSTPAKTTGCPEGQVIGDGGECVPKGNNNPDTTSTNPVGGDGGRSGLTHGLNANGLMTYHGSASV